VNFRFSRKKRDETRRPQVVNLPPRVEEGYESRYELTFDRDGKVALTFAYGYKRNPVMVYYCEFMDCDRKVIEGTHHQGEASEILSVVDAFGIELPEKHLRNLYLDLPI
jgi:hypothetical protein